MIKHENNEDKINEIIAENKKVLLKFGATWCSPCKILEETLTTISEMEEFKDVVFVSIDIEECESLVSRYRIRNVPVCIILEDGNIKDKLVGNVVAETIIKSL